MFASIFVAAFLALPAFVAAGDAPYNQCNTGASYCCNSVQDAKNDNSFAAQYLSTVGVDIASVTGQVGVTCSPLSAVGLSSTSCTQQPVCCTNNSFNGVVALGCSPINVGL